MYWKIGQRIFEEEQKGEERAGYGTFLIKTLAEQLEPVYGVGFSARQLERFRRSIVHSQMRPHCGRNLAGHIIS